MLLDVGGYFCVRTASSGRVCPCCRRRALRGHQHWRGEREVVASPARDETLQVRTVERWLSDRGLVWRLHVLGQNWQRTI